MKLCHSFAIVLLAGCATTNVQTTCRPTPIPAELVQPCEDPERVPDGRQATTYDQVKRDTEPWGRCARNHALLVKVIKERDSECQPAPAAANKDNPWWTRIFGGG